MAVLTRNNNDKRVIRTKKAICTALFKLMESKDISAITISELTTLANVNRRTFYTHYSNITDILDETESEIVDSLTEIILRFDTSDTMKSTYTLFTELSNLVTEQYSYYFHLMKSGFRSVLVSRMKNALKTTTDNILGQITAKADYDCDLPLAVFISGGFLNLFLEWNKEPNRLTLDDAAKTAGVMVDFCVNNKSAIIEKINNADFGES